LTLLEGELWNGPFLKAGNLLLRPQASSSGWQLGRELIGIQVLLEDLWLTLVCRVPQNTQLVKDPE